METSPKEIFAESLVRCITYTRFIPAFYDRFMGTSDEIREKFKFTSFELQKKLLIRSLQLSAGAISGNPESLAELKERAKTHDRNHLDIRPELYDVWLECLVATAKEFDNEWNDEVEHAWRAILGVVISRMAAVY